MIAIENLEPFSALSVFVREVTLHYNNIPLFVELSLTLQAGEWTSLLGPSGVGKSSLLHLLAGLSQESISAGTIRTSDGLPLRGRLAYLAQDDALLPWLGVLDNVLIGQRLRGAEEKKVQKLKVDHAHALLKEVGLSAALNKKISELSGGMRQRVALVRTLLENCPVVLMDEPFASLDAITRLELQDLAAKLLKGRTVLLVTHDPLEALRLSDVIYILAGAPARLSEPLYPPGKPLREMSNQQVLMLHAQLLQQLAQAKDQMQ